VLSDRLLSLLIGPDWAFTKNFDDEINILLTDPPPRITFTTLAGIFFIVNLCGGNFEANCSSFNLILKIINIFYLFF
jgi:hypothetical protein